MSFNLLQSTSRKQWQQQILSNVQYYQLSILKMSHKQMIEAVESERETNPYIQKKNYGSSKHSATEVIEKTLSYGKSFEQDLLDQLVFIYDKESKEYEVATLIIYSLDKYGYLSKKVDRRGYDESLFERVLSSIKGLTPMGCGCRDMREYFLYCLSSIGVEQTQDMYKKVDRYLELFEKHNDPLKVDEIMGIDDDEKQEMFHVLSQFQPYPRMDQEEGGSDDYTSYIVPEAFIEELDGELHVRMNRSDFFGDNIRENLLLNDDANSLKRDEEFLKEKKLRAEKLIDALEYRYEMTSAILKEILSFHRDYLLGTSQEMKPYSMTKIAKHLGVNPSTISRLISDKFVESRLGITPIRHFFNREVYDGKTVLEMQHLIASVLEKFDSQTAPLKDRQIVEVLKKMGINIAVRTVAKYRKEMGIPASRYRKDEYLKTKKKK